jgi:hypothetical protein
VVRGTTVRVTVVPTLPTCLTEKAREKPVIFTASPGHPKTTKLSGSLPCVKEVNDVDVQRAPFKIVLARLKSAKLVAAELGEMVTAIGN